MITPENYVRWPEPLEKLSEELEDFIISDICRRIKADGYITATAEIQMSALMMRGYNPKELQDKIAEFLGLADSEIQDLYEKAATESQRFEDEVYEKLGSIDDYFGFTSFKKNEWILMLNDLIQLYPDLELI